MNTEEPSKEGRVDPEQPKDPNCAACKQDWPIHMSEGKRYHLDLFAEKEYGVIVECPTTVWMEDE